MEISSRRPVARVDLGLLLLLLTLLPALPIAGQQDATSLTSLHEGQQFSTRLTRSYISKPLAFRPRDRARAESELTRFRSLDQRFGEQGKTLLRLMFKRIQEQYPELFGDKTLADYLDMFSTSPQEIQRSLRARMFSLMVLYSRMEETVRLSSTVRRIAPDGKVVFKTTIDDFHLAWSPGGSYGDLYFTTRKHTANDDPFTIREPFRALTDRPFMMTVTGEGNVVLGGSFRRIVRRARKRLDRLASDTHGAVLEGVRRRLLTASYVRMLIYQAWARPFGHDPYEMTQLNDVVFLSPLDETGGIRRRSFRHFKDLESGRRTFRLLKNIHRNLESEEETSIYPAAFSRLFKNLGGKAPFVNFDDFEMTPADLSTHAGGWVTVDPEMNHVTGLRYREVAYRSKPETGNQMLKRLLYVAEPPTGNYETPYGTLDYGTDLEYTRGYHLVHRLHIRMTRTRTSD